ncbi:putative N-acetyltransferase domain-containing protein [Vibrio chagasii]|nr:putative N-acetyltransferase domain-containing protein [Vibrio chagasii]CAH7415290.1 putative N-acetyltransferase domain-containing protein [Vibrio chagasii]CAH7424604.1 putative N-acetyltransferase domain-containing protein [Vibrio chagasii]
MNINVKKVDWHDKELVSAISNLLNSSFGTSDNLYFRCEFLVWKHKKNPFGESISYVAFDDDYNLLGLRTFLKWRFKINSETYHAVQPVDTATSPVARGKGIFSLLTRKALGDVNNEIVFNRPNKNSFPGYLKMGWLYQGDIRFGIMPRLKAYTNKHIIGERINEETFTHKNFSIHMNSDLRLRTETSPNFLKWRFLDIPGLNYKIIHVGESLSLVYKIKKRLSLNELVICDFFGEQGDVSKTELFSTLQSLLVNEKCHYAVVCFKDRPLGVASLFFKVPLKKMKVVSKSKNDFVFSLTDIEVF